MPQPRGTRAGSIPPRESQTGPERAGRGAGGAAGPPDPDPAWRGSPLAPAPQLGSRHPRGRAAVPTCLLQPSPERNAQRSQKPGREERSPAGGGESAAHAACSRGRGVPRRAPAPPSPGSSPASARRAQPRALQSPWLALGLFSCSDARSPVRPLLSCPVYTARELQFSSQKDPKALCKPDSGTTSPVVEMQPPLGWNTAADSSKLHRVWSNPHQTGASEGMNGITQIRSEPGHQK